MFKKLDGVLKEIQTLKKRSELLDEILNYYNEETMTFEIPNKWKHNTMKKNNSPAESPRHLIYNKINETLSEEEKSNVMLFKMSMNH